MSILTWIAVGLVAGMIAKLIVPGKQGGGLLITTLIGIGGAMLGGYLGGFLNVGVTGVFTLASITTAVVGAIILIFLFGLVFGRKA